MSNLKNASDEMLRRVLGRLPRRLPPPGLTTALRVAASKERLRRGGFGKALLYWFDRLQWEASDAMRALALPVVGGVFSAVILLGMWVVPTYPVRADNNFDVPTTLTANSFMGTATPGPALCSALSTQHPILVTLPARADPSSGIARHRPTPTGSAR